MFADALAPGAIMTSEAMILACEVGKFFIVLNCYVGLGSGNDLMPNRQKSLSGPTVPEIIDAIWQHSATWRLEQNS